MASTFVSHLNITGDSIISGPVPVDPFVPDSANLFPKMVNRIDDSAWELWQFDSFSADGETAVSVSFYRDTRTLKQGGFHVDVNAIWPDGSKWGQMLFFPESIVTSEGACAHKGCVHGVWKSETASTTFSIEEDLSTTTVRFSVPGCVTGTIELRSLGGGRESRLPVTESSALLSPSVYYIFPMGPATATMDLAFSVVDEASGTVHEKKQHVSEDDGARGSIVRGWSALAFPQMFTDAYYLNATIGPYMMQLIRIISSAATGRKPHTVARLYHNEELVCGPQHIIDAQLVAEDILANDTVAVEKVLHGDGGLAAVFCDKNIGYVIEFIQGGTQQQKKHWRFEARHKLAWWSEPTSAPGPQGTGKSGFIEAVFGGLDGGMSFKGAGLAGQLQLP